MNRISANVFRMSQATLHPERFLGESLPLTTHGEEQLCQGLLSFVLQSVRGNKKHCLLPQGYCWERKTSWDLLWNAKEA